MTERKDYLIRCKTKERRDFLKEKINTAYDLIDTRDVYSLTIKALDLLIHSVERQKNAKHYQA